MWGYWKDYPKQYRNGQEYANIDGRLYSEHACEHLVPSYLREAGAQARGYGIPPSYVEDVIRRGTSYSESGGKTRYEYGTLKVVVNDFGAVVTIMN